MSSELCRPCSLELLCPCFHGFLCMTQYRGASSLVSVFAPPFPSLSTAVSCAAEICFVDNACHWYTPGNQFNFLPYPKFQLCNKTHRMKFFLSLWLPALYGWPWTLGRAGRGRGTVEFTVKDPQINNSSFSSFHYYVVSPYYASDWEPRTSHGTGRTKGDCHFCRSKQLYMSNFP